MWAWLSVFAAGFEPDAAEQVCGAELGADSALDLLASLVDKSILIRDESDNVVRFRMLETLGDYGRRKLQESGEYQLARRRHRDWYQRLALAAEAEWISDHQLDWLARLDREQPNLRDGLEYCLAEDTEDAAVAGLRTASALVMFWTFRGLNGEGRHWLDRVLAHPRALAIPDRVKALHADVVMATYQGDLQSAAAVLEEADALAEKNPSPLIQALVAYADGVLAFYRGDHARASSSLKRALQVFDADREAYWYVSGLTVLGWANALHGDTRTAIEYHERVFSITAARGEWLFRSSTLWGMGMRHGSKAIVVGHKSCSRKFCGSTGRCAAPSSPHPASRRWPGLLVPTDTPSAELF